MTLTARQYAVAFSVVMGEIGGLPPNPAAVDTLESMIATAKGSKKKEVLSGIGRMISDAGMMPLERRSRVNAILAEKGVPTLEALADLFDRAHEAILRSIPARGSILDDEECRLVERELGDGTSDLTDAQRRTLGEMINKFEGR
jgi:hypothetical protein